MIRFIDLGKQTWIDGEVEGCARQFCFYNTSSDRFIEIDGVQVFDSWDELVEIAGYAGMEVEGSMLRRLWGLCPSWVKEGSDGIH